MAGAIRNKDPYLVVPSGLRVVQRDEATVQLGFRAGAARVVHDLPSGAAELLTELDGRHTLSEMVDRLCSRCGGEPGLWAALFDDLVACGVLHEQIPGAALPRLTDSAVVRPDFISLTRRYGPRPARTLIARRNESVVVVQGSGRLAGSVASILACAGVGHLHLRPDRRLHPADVAPAGLACAVEPEPDRSKAPATAADHPDQDSADDADGRRRDRLRLDQLVRRTRPDIAVQAPTGNQSPPDLVVLAGDQPARSEQTALLLTQAVPHLVCHADSLAGTVGPLVLAGRSCCLRCTELHRMDADPGWSLLAGKLPSTDPAPPSALVTTVAAAAAAQVLQLLDGTGPPDTVDGSLAFAVDSWQIRRRSWPRHPDCPCQHLFTS